MSHVADVLLAAKRPYFCGREESSGQVPDLPFAIIVPVSLVAQWLSELRTFIGDNKIEIYVFPTATAEWAKFWAPSSPWSKSKQPMHLRVVIFQHSVSLLMPLAQRTD